MRNSFFTTCLGVVLLAFAAGGILIAVSDLLVRDRHVQHCTMVSFNRTIRSCMGFQVARVRTGACVSHYPAFDVELKCVGTESFKKLCGSPTDCEPNNVDCLSVLQAPRVIFTCPPLLHLPKSNQFTYYCDASACYLDQTAHLPLPMMVVCLGAGILMWLCWFASVSGMVDSE